MNTEIWKCDHCNKEENKQGDMKFLVIIMLDNMKGFTPYSIKDKSLMTRLWCEKCIMENGMNERYTTIQTEEEAKNNPRPTFENKLADLLREVVEDEVQEQLSDQ